MSIPTYRTWVSQSPVFATGGSSSVLTQDLPDGRIIGVVLEMKMDVVQAAGAVAITGTLLPSVFNLIRIGERVRATGRGLLFLRWIMQGFMQQVAQDVPAAAGTYSRFVDVYIPFADLYATNPLDTAIDTRFISGEFPVEINWGNVAALFGANTSLANVSVRPIFYLDRPKPEEIQAETELQFTDWNQQSILMPATGAVSHMFAYSETTDAMTDAQFATFTVYTDGDVITPVLRTSELAMTFNLFKAAGVTALASATGVPGEMLVDEPGTGIGAGQGLTVPFIPIAIPLVGQSQGYSLTHLPYTQAMLRVDFTGANTAIRTFIRRVKDLDRARVTELARKKKLASPGERAINVRTQGSGTLTPKDARILPKFLGLHPEEARQRGGK
jgi:hypothetical protein